MSDSKKTRKRTKKKVVAKTTEKPVKKKVVKKVDEFSLEGIKSESKKFEVAILNSETEVETAPYKIPFRHKGLQKITGGIIGGKFAEISGNSQSGKSFLLYELMAECIAMGGVSLLFDGERAFEEPYAEMVQLPLRGGKFAFGEVRTEAQKKNGMRGEPVVDMDDVFHMMISFIKTVRKAKGGKKIPILIGIDSFPSLQTDVDLANLESGKDPRGYAAMQKNAKFSFWIEKFVGILDKYDATLVLLNQTRIDNTVMYGDKTTTLCETVIKFWATQRIQGKLAGKILKKVKSIENAKGKNIQIGMKTIWKTIKNRAVKPFQSVLTKIRYSKGIDLWSGLDELFVNEGLANPATTTKVADHLNPKPDLIKENDKGEMVFKKAQDGFKALKHKEGLENKFFYNEEELVADYPEFLEPSWTGVSEDEDEEFEEDVFGDEE